MAKEDEVQARSDGEGGINLPLSRAEQLIQAHPDITVVRDITGAVGIFQRLPDSRIWRHITIDVTPVKGSQRHYPSVTLTSYDHPAYHVISDDIVMDIRRHGVTTM